MIQHVISILLAKYIILIMTLNPSCSIDCNTCEGTWPKPCPRSGISRECGQRFYMHSPAGFQDHLSFKNTVESSSVQTSQSQHPFTFLQASEDPRELRRVYFLLFVTVEIKSEMFLENLLRNAKYVTR